LNKLLIGLLIAGMVLIQCLIGGTRLVFSIPTYTILAVAAVLSIFMVGKSKATPSLTCLVVSTLFFTYILVRAAVSPVDYLGWQDFYMVLGCLLVYGLTAFYITTPAQRGAIVIAFLVIAVVHVFVGLRQFAVGDDWNPFGFIRGTGLSYGRRASGLLIHAIHLAGYLEAVAVFALSLAFWSTWRATVRFLMGYIAALCYVGIAITGSRGGYLSAAFSLCVFALLCLIAYRKARPSKFPQALLITATSLALVLGGAVFIMNQSEFLRDRLGRIMTQLEEKNRDVRIYNWQAALDQFKEAPLLGTGAGTHLYYGRLFRRPQLQADPIHAHNDYLELIAEYGVVGGIGMAAFLLAHFWTGARAIGSVLRREFHGLSEYEPARNDVLALQIGAFSAIAAYLVHSVTDFNLHIPGNALLFAFIFGLLANPGTADRTGRAASVSRWFRFAVPSLGLLVLILALPRFPGEYWGEKARAALRDGEFADSIRLGLKAEEAEKRNPFIYFHLGGAYRGSALVVPEEKDKAELRLIALAAYIRALTLFPNDVNAQIRMGETLGEMSRFKDAELAFQAAIALDPNNAITHAYYARHLARMGRQKEAEARLAEARAISGEGFEALIGGTSLHPEAARP
jgi:O-antigen ligase